MTGTGRAVAGNRPPVSRLTGSTTRTALTLAFFVAVLAATAACSVPVDPAANRFSQKNTRIASPAATAESAPSPSPGRPGDGLGVGSNAGRQPDAATTPASPGEGSRQFRVGNTGGDGVYLRRAPAGGEALRLLADDTVVAVVGPSQMANGRTWQQVEAPGGVVGWIATDFLVASHEPVAVATPTAASAIPRSATPSPGDSTATSPHGLAYVGNTGGQGVYLRRTPVMADRVVPWPDGTPMEILGDETWSEGRTWRLVRDPAGGVGWVPSAYLALADAPSGDGDDGVAAGSDESTFVFAQRWQGEIPFCVNAANTPAPLAPSDFHTAVDRAFALWQAATGGAIPLVNQGECDGDPTNLRDGRNTIGWGSMNEAGVTSVRYVRLSIVEADVVINRSLAPRRDALECLSYVVTHELGHFVGLAHASSSVQSVMVEGGGRCRTIDQLFELDVRNIRLLYPGRVS